MDASGLQKFIKKIKKRGREERRERKKKEGRKKRGERKNYVLSHTPCHSVSFHILCSARSFIAGISAIHLSLTLHTPFSNENLGCESTFRRNHAVFTQWKSTDPTNPQLSSCQAWQKDTELRPMGMRCHVPVSEPRRGTQSVQFTAACPTLTDTVIGNADQRLLLACTPPQFPGLERRPLCLASVTVVPVLVTE